MPRKLTKSQLDNLKLGRQPGKRKPVTTQSVTLEIEREMIAEIDAIAETKGISRGAEIRYRLEMYTKLIEEKS
jgi:hypothetical protein